MKNLLKKNFIFFISFFIGISLVSFYNATETSRIQQKTLDVKTKIAYFKSPKPLNCNNPLAKLIQKRAEIMDWVGKNAKNKSLSKKQLSAKAKELEKLNKRIEFFKNLENPEKYNQREERPIIDLLYREKCCDF